MVIAGILFWVYKYLSCNSMCHFVLDSVLCIITVVVVVLVRRKKRLLLNKEERWTFPIHPYYYYYYYFYCYYSLYVYSQTRRFSGYSCY